MTQRPLVPASAAIGLALLAGLAAAGHAQAQQVLKFHHDLPESSAQRDGAVRFEELVEERTDGGIDVQIFANNALGDDVEVAQQMQFGAVHAAPIPTAKLANFAPALQLLDLPFLFPGRETAYAVLDGEVGTSILAELESAGFTGAKFWESGFKQLTCNKEVTAPGDLNGVKARVIESAPDRAVRATWRQRNPHSFLRDVLGATAGCG